MHACACARTPGIYSPDFSAAASTVIFIITQHNMAPLLRLLTGSPASSLLLLYRIHGMTKEQNLACCDK